MGQASNSSVQGGSGLGSLEAQASEALPGAGGATVGPAHACAWRPVMGPGGRCQLLPLGHHLRAA